MIIRVRGRSMTPAFQPGHFLWVRPSRPGLLRREAVVLVRRSRHPEGLYLKRLVGLPGEEIRLERGGLWIDGRPLEEPYVPAASALEPRRDQRTQLGPDEYFVLGDARDDSLDSRSFGPILAEEITGVVRCRVWPPFRCL